MHGLKGFQPKHLERFLNIISQTQIRKEITPVKTLPHNRLFVSPVGPRPASKIQLIF